MTYVLANGCFDLLHVGHIAHLEEARKMGGYLIVAVTLDEFVGKGRGRPVESIDERMRKLKALRCVSAVSVCKNAIQALQNWRPDIFVKGCDYKDRLRKDEIAYCLRHGIEIRYTNSPKYSTSELIERINQCA